MSSPEQQPRYAPYVQPSTQPQGQGPSFPTPSQRAPFNTLGLIALIVLAVSLLFSLIQPVFFHQLMAQSAATLSLYSMVMGIVFVLLYLAALGLAIPGAVTKRPRRGVWLSWVAIGAAGMSLISWLLSSFGGMMASAMNGY